MSSRDIEKAIRAVIRKVSTGSQPAEVVASVETLIKEINNDRRSVVVTYLQELAQEWPEGRERLTAEADKLRAEIETPETLDSDG